jgi:AP-2 complex subunit alpha
MLGYEVDFGHLEFISLMVSQNCFVEFPFLLPHHSTQASTKYSEKAVGYMAISLMLKPSDELITLVINSMRNDIVGQMHGGQSLGLAAVCSAP